MDSTITKRTDTEATIKVSVGADELAPVVKQTFDRLRGRVKVSGFRPGKAPDTIVERELGSEITQQEVLQAATARSYAQAVKKLEIVAVAPPKVSLTKFVPYTELEYTATIEILPAIKLPDYKQIKKVRPQAEVKPEEVEQVIDDLRRRAADRVKVNRPAQMGDEVVIDFEGSRNGQKITGASSQNYTLALGSGNFVPGFEESLIGSKTEEQKEFDVVFPKDYAQPDLAGQPVNFNVTVHQVMEVKLPEADQQFVEQISNLKSLDELKSDIGDRLKADKQQHLDRQYEQEVLDELIRKADFKVPGSLIAEQTSRLADEMNHNLSHQGSDLDKYLELKQKTREDLEKDLRPEAERRVRLAVLLTEIAKQEKLRLTERELAEEVARLKQVYPDEQMQRELDTPTGRENVYNHLMAEKVIAKILEQVEPA